MSAMKGLYEDIKELIDDGETDDVIFKEICLMHNFPLEKDDWLSRQIQCVREMG